MKCKEMEKERKKQEEERERVKKYDVEEERRGSKRRDKTGDKVELKSDGNRTENSSRK